METSAILCTYCSYEKDRNPEWIPSIRRYASKRISFVYDLAKEMELGFRILSGEYGILSPDEKIPWYDHLLLAEEAGALSKKIAEQLKAAHFDSVIYYTKAPESNPNVRPYLAAIREGCSSANVNLEIRLINGGREMTSWREIMNHADAAKKLMISDRKAGEEEFRKLIEKYPSDGMIYFKRGEAFEVIEEYSTALGDFEKAEILLPMQEWKLRVQTAIERVKGKADNISISNAYRELVYDRQQLGDIYDSLQKLLTRIEKNKIPDEKIYDQIPRLKSEGLIVSKIEVLMNTLRIARNKAIHEHVTFSGKEAEVIRAAWAAICEWAVGAGYQVDDLYKLD